MEKIIYNYIKENEVVSIHDVSKSLSLPDIFVLKTVLKLRAESFVRIHPAVPLSISNNESCYYSTTSKKYSPTTRFYQTRDIV